MSGPQPPPARPWFRLASMVRPADPRPPPPPPPPPVVTPPPPPPQSQSQSPPQPPPTISVAAASPSPKKQPASPSSSAAAAAAAATPTSTRNTPPAPASSPPAPPPRADEPRSPVVATRRSMSFMSPGVPRLPTTSPSAAPFFTQTTAAPPPPTPPVPSVPSPKPIVDNDKLQPATTAASAYQEEESRKVITSTTGRSSIASPTPSPSPKSPYKPKPTSMAPPPSPLLLPPPQISAINNEPARMIPPEAEQKTVLVQEQTIPATTALAFPVAAARPITSFHQLHDDNNVDAAAARRINGVTAAHHHHHPLPAAANNYNYKEDEADKMMTTTNKQPSSKLLNKKKSELSEQEVGMKVITIAGENRGAIMELLRSPHPPASGKLVGRRLTDNEQDSYSSGSGSGKEGRRYNKSSKDKSDTSSIPMNAFMNSNVQGVNNSILYNAQCTHHDPGVHVSLSRKPSSNLMKTKARNATKG